jgi:hypothetical protein
MSGNKEIKFSFVVDERSAQQAKRVIRDLISDAEKLAKTLNGVGLGGGGGGGGGFGGNLVTGSVGGGKSAQQMISSIQSKPKQGGGLAQVFIDNAQALKGLGNISRESMRVMSDSIKRAVDEQKRAIAGLDDQLAKLARRYDDLGAREKAAIANGLSPDKARALYNEKAADIQSQIVSTQVERQKAMKGYNTLDEQRRQMAINGGGGVPPDEPPSGGGYGNSRFGKMFPMRTPDGRLVRWGAMGAAAVTGLVAGAGELQAQQFDYISNQARQAQAMKTMGVATRTGDLQYAAALMQVMRDPMKRAEFTDVGNSTISRRDQRRRRRTRELSSPKAQGR